MLQYITDTLRAAETSPLVQSREDAFDYLRQIGFEDFAEVLLLMPIAEFPKMSRLLPAMASEEVQAGWTGRHGYPLLTQSTAFIRSVVFNQARFGRKPINECKVLDYGCGYGCLARLMYYFVGSDDFYGVDPWDRSIEECRKAGLTTNFVQSSFLPTSLPVGQATFDLAYAFSVFTHLSERALLRALAAMRKCMAPDGLAVITIRPIEYWDVEGIVKPEQRDALKRAHRECGFAFFPMGFPSDLDGELTYGHTSMSFEWFDSNVPGWKRVGLDRHLDDFCQTYLILKPV